MMTQLPKPNGQQDGKWFGRKLIDLTGQHFGRWTVVGLAFRRNRRIFWTCLCECGTIKPIIGLSLTKSNQPSRSCGCLKAEVARTLNTIHGDARSVEWRILQKIKERCLNPHSRDFPAYGGRGITICPQWQIASGYELFLREVGCRPTPKHQIERKDNACGYEPGNIKWATRREQARNRRNNVHIVVNGQDMLLTDTFRFIKASRYWYMKKLHPEMTPQQVYDVVAAKGSA